MTHLDRLSAWALALCVVASGTVVAQTDPPTVGSPAVQQSTGGIAYISGGAGDEERSAMDARQREFPLKLVLSAGSGEYIVADKLSLVTPQGEVLVMRDAGPVVMVKLPPGAYTVEASYQGRIERRPVQVGGSAQTVGLRFPG